MLFTEFLASKWRWLAYCLAILLAVLVLTQAQQYASTWWARRKVAQQVEATEANRAARLADEAHHRSSFDSTIWVQAARHREFIRLTRLQKKLDDSLSKILPAMPVLPQRPARY